MRIRWEYKCEKLFIPNGIEKLDELGADGWELVCIDGMHCIFKRPRE